MREVLERKAFMSERGFGKVFNPWNSDRDRTASRKPVDLREMMDFATCERELMLIKQKIKQMRTRLLRLQLRDPEAQEVQEIEQGLYKMLRYQYFMWLRLRDMAKNEARFAVARS